MRNFAAAHDEDAGVASLVAAAVHREIELNRLAVQNSTRDKCERTVVVDGATGNRGLGAAEHGEDVKRPLREMRSPERGRIVEEIPVRWTNDGKARVLLRRAERQVEVMKALPDAADQSADDKSLCIF